MGIDVYIHAEVKIRGTWHHYGNYEPFRWYLAFGLMAGVKGDQQMFGPARGIPADASDTTRALYDLHCDYGSPHNPSWLNSQEIEELGRRLASMDEALHARTGGVFRSGDLDRWLGGHLFSGGWNRRSVEHYDVVEDFRWVFWFD